MNFDEALKRAACDSEQRHREKASREREDEARQQQAAIQLKELGQVVLSTCQSRDLPQSGVATFKERWLGGSHSFKLIRRVWQVGVCEIDESGQLYTRSNELWLGRVNRYSDHDYHADFAKELTMASNRFGVKQLLQGGSLLEPVAAVDTSSEYPEAYAGIGIDGQLYMSGYREALMILLARALEFRD